MVSIRLLGYPHRVGTHVDTEIDVLECKVRIEVLAGYRATTTPVSKGSSVEPARCAP